MENIISSKRMAAGVSNRKILAEEEAQAENDRLQRYQRHELNAKEEKLKKDFLSLDRDGDGQVSIDEMGKILRAMRTKLRMSESEIKRTLREFDMDGDGEIEISEFLFILGTSKKKDLIHKAIVQHASIHQEFKQYDVDNNGYITREDFLKAYQARTGRQPNEQDFKRFDLNDDGQITYDEFLHFFMNTAYKSAV